MLKHIVMWNIKEECFGKTKKENLIEMKKILENMDGKIDVLKNIEVGINMEKASDKNYDIILITEFNKFEDLATYDKHPEHEKVREFVKQVAIERAAIDFEY
ncbi:MAG: Dabb family protein [Fusobacteria bacterium]|nr:Dabb family protein [Fusobacteriota bacterium]